MRRLIVLLTLALCTGLAEAGSYTVTTTAEQDDALKVLAERRAPAKVTPQQLVQQVVDSFVRTTVSDMQRKTACEAVKDTQHKQVLGCAPTK